MNTQESTSTPTSTLASTTGGIDEQLLAAALTALNHGMTFEEFDALANDDIKTTLRAAGTTIIIAPLASPTKEQFAQEIHRLEELSAELMRTISTTRDQNDTIKQRIEALRIAHGVKINTEHYQSFEESITTYLMLLANIQEEIEREMAIYRRYLDFTAPLTLLVAKEHATLSSDTFIQQKMLWLRHHAKVIRKDLAISFSRYSFGFEKQLRQIEAIEAHFKRNAA